MVAFRACRRRHHYQYDLRIKPVKQSKPLNVGTALHRWLEVWFTRMALAMLAWICPNRSPAEGDDDFRDLDDDKHVAARRIIEEAFGAVEADDPFEAAKLRAMVLAYHLRWRQQTFKVLAVEAEFRAPLVNPLTNRTSQKYERGGKIDGIVEIDTTDPEWEGVWLLEHKSNKGPLDPEDTYWQRLRMDPQCSDYWIGAHALGYEPRGIIYDVVCKPEIQPLKATAEHKREKTIGMGCKICGGSKATAGHGFMVADLVIDIQADRRPCPVCKGSGWKDEPRWKSHVRLNDETPGEYGMRCFEAMLTEPERYLHRYRVVRLHDEMIEHAVDGWYTVRSMHEQKESGVAPRNPDACFMYHRQCDYYPLCTKSASMDDARLYRISVKHPELRVVNDG